MDLNLIVIAGRLTAEPELRHFESGTSILKLLVTVRTEQPRRRIDVLPVVLWDPSKEQLEQVAEGNLRGRAIWVAGAAQRRFWSQTDGSQSRVEIVAHEVQIREADVLEETAAV